MPDFQGKVNITKDGQVIIVLDGETGKVGIGTAEPQAILQVVGPLRADSPTTAPGIYDEFIAHLAPGYANNFSNRELRIQSYNDQGLYHQFLLYNGRITGGTISAPTYTQGAHERFCGIEFAGGDIHFLVNTGSASTGAESPITATRSLTIENTGNVGVGTTNPEAKLHVMGTVLAEDVVLTHADCAEEFDVETSQALEPGTVMVIGEEETLHPCTDAYDKRVAGVISGAGDCKPGIVLGKQHSPHQRLPVALTGKVYCKVDAHYAPITVGDLLTTSATPGHAMKATDPLKAFGAVIGKALCPLREGCGLIPILIALQ